MRRLFLVVLIAGSLLAGGCTRRLAYPEPPRVGENLAFDISALPMDTPLFFSYRYRGEGINFFLVKTDREVLSFLDACRECSPKKLGFRFEKGYVICKACNERYPLSEIGTGFGSCYPIRIKGQEKNGQYLIPVSHLKIGTHPY